MSSGGVWWSSTVTMVGFLASGGLWWTATAGTGLALQCQVILGTERYSMIGWGLGLGILETRCVCSKLIVPILGFSILLAIIPENMVFCILPYQFIFFVFLSLVTLESLNELE